jgi:aspartate-semialdehyde dehydrogenase
MTLKKEKYTVAVAGAAGLVGKEIIEILEERNFPLSQLVPLDSEELEGERIQFQGKSITIRRLSKDSFSGVDIALFSAGPDLAGEFAPKAVKAGAVVIDDSGAFTNDASVPVVVSEVNLPAISKHKGIIANASRSVIPLVATLKPIHDAVKIRRIVVTTFQSVSGTGKRGMDELAQQTVALLNFRDVETKVYPHQIAFNCLPQVGQFLESGYTNEEMMLATETRKILGDDSIGVAATAVRVPVFRCDSESVNIETERKISANEVRALLAGTPGLMVYDDPQKDLYPLPIDMTGKDEVYVGRIREDESLSAGINLWIVSDNIRKGAALNAVQIAEHLIR